jgi:serine/threonine-protein kinase RsbW
MNIKIPSDIKLVHKTSAEILSSLKELKINESDLFDIRFSLEEALINAIKHGNQGNLNLMININLEKRPDKVEISVEDEGGGFNVQDVPDPTKRENLLKGSGRGVFLIQKLMDKVEYFNQGRGIKMIKKLKGG